MPTASPPPRALTERDYRVGYILLLSILAAFIFIAIRLITKVWPGRAPHFASCKPRGRLWMLKYLAWSS